MSKIWFRPSRSLFVRLFKRKLTLRSFTISFMIGIVAGSIYGATGCAVGEVGPGEPEDVLVAFNDDDRDGVSDAVDVDGDGASDYTIEPCTTCQVGASAFCRRPLIDEDNDGFPDGLDTNCDGTIDQRLGFTKPGTGGSTTGAPGPGSRCLSSASINGTQYTASCQNGSCQCKRNGQLLLTCGQTTHTCSLSIRNGAVSASCCQF